MGYKEYKEFMNIITNDEIKLINPPPQIVTSFCGEKISYLLMVSYVIAN